MFRIFGLGVMLLTVASTGIAAEHYVEIWNPPEARASMPHRSAGARKPAAGRHVGPHAVAVHARRSPAAPAAVTKLAAKTDTRENVPVHVPDMTEIPRQITPEGNVLRVDSRGATVEVMR